LPNFAGPENQDLQGDIPGLKDNSAGRLTDGISREQLSGRPLTFGGLSESLDDNM
jgi:hypothetical protein